MITAEKIAAALNLTGVTLHVSPEGLATISSDQPVSDAQQARVQAWFNAGEIVVQPEYIELRAAAYVAEGVTPEALAIALREKLGEDRPDAFDALQAKASAIKARYPKPTQ